LAQVKLAVPGKIHWHYGSPCNCYLNKPNLTLPYLTNLAFPTLSLQGDFPPQSCWGPPYPSPIAQLPQKQCMKVIKIWGKTF